MWPYAVRTLALRVPPGPCSRSGVSRAVWCPLHPALAGTLGVCWNGLIGTFLISEMGESWAGRIACKFFSYDNYSFSISSLLVFLALPWGEGWVRKSNGSSLEEPWALSREGPGSGGWFLGGYDEGTSCLRSPDEMWWCLELWWCGRLLEKPPQWKCPPGGVGLDGSPCCPSSWTHQIFSTQGAGRRLGQLGRARSWLTHQPAQMATWPGASFGAWCGSTTVWPGQVLVHCLGSRRIAYGQRRGHERERRD